MNYWREKLLACALTGRPMLTSNFTMKCDNFSYFRCFEMLGKAVSFEVMMMARF